MATQYDPILKDSTGQAIVTKLEGIKNAINPTAENIPITTIEGMEAENVQSGLEELKGTLDELGNIRFQSAFNANSIDVDFGFVPSTSNGGQILLFNSNQTTVALITFGVSSSSTVVFGTKTYNVSVSGTVITITPNSTLWGITTMLIDEIHI